LQNAWCVFTQSPPKGHARSHHSVPGIFSRWTVPPFIPLPHACPKFWFWGSCVPSLHSPLFFFLRRRTARETGNIPRRAPFNPVGEHVQSSTRPLPSFPSHPLRPIASSRTSRNSRGTLLPSSAHHTRAVQGERGVRTRHSHLLTAPPPYLTLDGSASRVNKGARLR
jgi:hypothetical protein